MKLNILVTFTAGGVSLIPGCGTKILPVLRNVAKKKKVNVSILALSPNAPSCNIKLFNVF